MPAPPESAFAPLVVPAPPEPPPPAPPPVYQGPPKTPGQAAPLAPDSPAAAAVGAAVAALPADEKKVEERAQTVEDLASMREVTKAFCQATFFLNNWAMGKYVYGLTTTEAIGLPPPTEPRVQRSTDLMQPLVARWVGKHVTAATLAAFLEIHLEHAGATAAFVVKIQEDKRKRAERAAANSNAIPSSSIAEEEKPAPPPAASNVIPGVFGNLAGARVTPIAPPAE